MSTPRTAAEQLMDQLEHLGETMMRVKSERDQLIIAIRKYFDADSSGAEYNAREAMRDAVERATGERP